MMPEVTFAPRQIYVVAKDVSVGGCRLIAKGVTPDLYRVMIREIRHGKLELDLQDRRVLNLRGRIVWMEYAGDETRLAMAFQQLPLEAETLLSNLLVALKDSGQISEVEFTRPSVDLKPID
jgi:hypothetical protein